jgi:hypothetical protein
MGEKTVFMALAATDFRSFDFDHFLRTHGEDFHFFAQAEQRLVHTSFEDEVGTSVLSQDIWYRTTVAQAGSPSAAVGVAVDQAALLCLAAAKVIGVIEPAFFAGGRSHSGSDSK